MACPEPSAPVRKINVPIADNSGMIRSIVTGSPPTMMASVPLTARLTPRTPARQRIDALLHQFRPKFARSDRIGQLMSNNTMPGLSCARIAATTASRTIGPLGSSVITAAASATASAASPATRPPAATKLLRAVSETSNPVTANPALMRHEQ